MGQGQSSNSRRPESEDSDSSISINSNHSKSLLDDKLEASNLSQELEELEKLRDVSPNESQDLDDESKLSPNHSFQEAEPGDEFNESFSLLQDLDEIKTRFHKSSEFNDMELEELPDIIDISPIKSKSNLQEAENVLKERPRKSSKSTVDDDHQKSQRSGPENSQERKASEITTTNRITRASSSSKRKRSQSPASDTTRRPKPSSSTSNSTSDPSPSKMTMFQLLSSPMLLACGFDLMRMLNEPNGMENIYKRLGEVKKSRKRKRKVKKVNLSLGDRMMKEIFSRIKKNRSAANRPLNGSDDDEYLIRNFFNIENLIPDYENKLRLQKMHFKKIQDIPIDDLGDYFILVDSEVKGIFEGRINSIRHNLYNAGRKNEDQLKEIAIGVPFDGIQASVIINYLYDYLVPDKAARMEYIQYITLVALPETLLRMYARICEISLELAENELKYKAIYEESIESLDANAKSQLTNNAPQSTVVASVSASL